MFCNVDAKDWFQSSNNVHYAKRHADQSTKIMMRVRQNHLANTAANAVPPPLPTKKGHQDAYNHKDQNNYPIQRLFRCAVGNFGKQQTGEDGRCTDNYTV